MNSRICPLAEAPFTELHALLDGDEGVQRQAFLGDGQFIERHAMALLRDAA